MTASLRLGALTAPLSTGRPDRGESPPAMPLLGKVLPFPRCKAIFQALDTIETKRATRTMRSINA